MPGSGGEDALVDKLASLDRLHQAGELTDEEFTPPRNACARVDA
jgi:hypothetical protein